MLLGSTGQKPEKRAGRALTSTCTWRDKPSEGAIETVRGFCVSSQTANFYHLWHQVLRKALPSAEGGGQP